ncbi:MAG TPA: hypothetical protein VFO73_01830 [Candidatus Limnocylindrales bacterium]|nr:hypothetical protein [Candidatus Limnocylindrales bacterium]
MTGQPTHPDPTDRIGPFLDALARLNVDDLGMVALPEPDRDARAALLQRALDAAHAAGRRDALVEAPVRARDALFASFARRAYDPTWFGLNWGRSLGRAADRARLIAAVEDAAVAEVVADVLGPDDVASLREPFEIASSMVGTAPSASPSIDGSPARRVAVASALGAGMLTAAAIGGGILAFLAAVVGRRRKRPTDARDEIDR